MSILPKPRPVLRVGVVGHTAIEDHNAVESAMRGCLEGIRSAAQEAFGSPSAKALYESGEPELRFVTNAAPGADQLALGLAHKLGYKVSVILPLPLDDYCSQLEEAAAKDLRTRIKGFERLELPGVTGAYEDRVEDAYVLATRMLIDHVDIVVALWQGPAGEIARESGSSLTRRAITMAQQRNVPVLWIPTTDQADDLRLRARLQDAFVGKGAWSPLQGDALSTTLRSIVDPYQGAATARATKKESVWRKLWREVCGKHKDHGDDATEARLQDALRKARAVLESPPLPTASTWIHRFSDWAAEHSPFELLMKLVAEPKPKDPNAGPTIATKIDQAMTSADERSILLMRRYRANFSWIFTLGACAVLFAVLAFLFKPLVAPVGIGLAALEVLAVLVILYLHANAHSEGWQQRAIDARLCAELLRQAKSIRVCYVNVARPRGDGVLAWPQWYLQALLREVDLDKGDQVLDLGVLRKRCDTVREELIKDQRNWYAKKQGIHHRAHELLHRSELRIFSIVVAACTLSLISIALPSHASVDVLKKLLFVLTAGLPAIAAACHGIAVQAELARIADSYHRMVKVLDMRLARLDALVGDIKLAELQREVSTASNLMLAEVEDWTRSYGVHLPPIA